MRIYNSLGYPIGVTDGEAKLVIGVDPAGRFIDIHQAERGAKCGLICPECGLPLIARKGEIKAHHFAHAPGHICIDETGALETQAHRFAKEVLVGASLLLPDFQYLGETGDRVTVSSAIIEESRGPIRPDLICGIVWKNKLTNEPKTLELAIEIKVTHRVSAMKAASFAQQKLRCIEIDIARYRFCSDEEIKRAVIFEAPRRWVWKKPPMPIARPEVPNIAVPRTGKFSLPPPFPNEFTADDWAAFNRRHFKA